MQKRPIFRRLCTATPYQSGQRFMHLQWATAVQDDEAVASVTTLETVNTHKVSNDAACDDGLVKATKLNKDVRYPTNHRV
jgi:hypothetical protein